MPLQLNILRVLTTALFLASIAPTALIIVTPPHALAQTTQNGKAKAEQLNQQGIQQYKRAEYQQALESFQEALVLFQSVGDRSSEGKSLNNIGFIYNSLGQYPEALKFYQQALTIYKEVRDRPQQGITLNNIGLIYSNNRQYDEAFKFYQQALAISKSIGDRSGEGTTFNNIGLIYSRSGEHRKALESYQQSLAISMSMGNRFDEGATLNNIGLIYSRSGKHRKALEFYQQSLVIRKEIGDRSGEGTTLNNIGSLLEAQKQTALAIVFLKQSVSTYEQIRGDLKVLPLNQQKSYTDTIAGVYRRLADLLLQQDRVLEAQQILDLLKVQELDDYLQSLRGTAQLITFLQHEREILQKYGELQKTAIELGSELANLRKFDSKNALNSAQQQRLTQLVKLETDINAQFIAFVDSTEIKNLAAKSQQNSANETINLPEIRKLKDKLERLDAVLLYPLILNDRLELVLSIPGSPPLHRTVKVKREELNRTIAEFRSALGSRDSKAQALAEKLYGWLIQPIEADLKQAHPKTILYAPDGQLRYIPIAALHDSKQWLIERYRINNITALAVSDLVTPPHKDQPILAAAFGNNQITIPVDNQSFQFAGLPFAQKEVQSLVSKRPGTVSLFGPDFSLATLQTRMNSFRIVHLATHGKFLIGNPKKSFLVMGNGDRLSLDSIQDSSLDNIDLVVLSACETGVGLTGKDEDGVEVLGIGYQFQRGGAKAAISSLWSINDGSTQTLMNIFYGLLQQGVPKAEALQQAQIALINGDFTAGGKLRSNFVIEIAPGQTTIPTNLKHPFYWAPFILIGNGL
jgi:CHAT domain-containing protein/tetratricopeptide (TPR) repeat protein